MHSLSSCFEDELGDTNIHRFELIDSILRRAFVSLKSLGIFSSMESRDTIERIESPFIDLSLGAYIDKDRDSYVDISKNNENGKYICKKDDEISADGF